MIRLGSGRRGPATLTPRYANRHGLITGATGSGKTVSMLRLASEFNRLGVPVFMPDVKGDLCGSGIAPDRLRVLIPGGNVHLSLLRMGGELAARALGLTDAQAGVLEASIANGTKAVHSPVQVLSFVKPGDATPATRRALIRAMARTNDKFFGPIHLDVASLITADNPVTVMDARELVESGSLYAATMVYMLRELYGRLPERGDQPLPLLAFFVDEAHLLFKDCPPRLLSELEKVVRLIRSKGVSLWFVTQSPADIPSLILGQLANRVQHSLRAATPQDWQAVQVAVNTMPPAPGLDMVATVGSMQPGSALVSFLDAKGLPQPSDLIRVDRPAWQAKPAAGSLTVSDAIPTAPVRRPIQPRRVARLNRMFDMFDGFAKLVLVLAAFAPFIYLVFTVGLALFGFVAAILFMAVHRSGPKHGGRH